MPTPDSSFQHLRSVTAYAEFYGLPAPRHVSPITLADGRSGTEYSCNLSLARLNELSIRVCLGTPMMGKTVTWPHVP